ncbi:hypothetical protein A2154_01910 [Candidatus Gottesmanbacteria bacterium RBG_16_43_7]|uniref:Glycosyltransferase RgtA/B/C/D-like domain-containing protein n=1 Tax=Candidatus Gottesmanbacteria bacterium RBG_16_43_7 TaxID=1798373 RepID=A0A1F5Z8H2_9BACT|nr:MAG: hypothetical protein A2154_01910 [Candidatus Gottesmanbacteria bacterium RBG_16_43_7]
MHVLRRLKAIFDTRVIVLLSILIVVGFYLRSYHSQEGIIFGYDQARDAYRAQSIAKDLKLKILGPETDIPGAHHGVGYYYILALAYGRSGSPTQAIHFMILIHALAVVLVYILAYLLFTSKRNAIAAASVFAISYEMIQYSRWLSNPSLGIFTVLITFTGLWLWIKGRSTGLTLAFIGAATSMHFQLFLAYLFMLILAAYWIYKPKVKRKSLVQGLISATVILLPFIVAELKYRFQTTAAFIGYFSGQSTTYREAADFLLKFINRLSSVSYYTLFPVNPVLAFLLLTFLISALYKKRSVAGFKYSVPGFLLFCLLCSFPIFIFSTGALNSEFGMLAVSVCLIMIAAYVWSEFYSRRDLRVWALVAMALFALVNIRFTLGNADKGAYIFSVQGAMTYGDELDLIDYTYQEAGDKPFSICTVTNPLFINTTWAFLYETYGKNTYGYVPLWAGNNQTGLLGNLPTDQDKPSLRYLIFEPDNGLPTHTKDMYIRLEDYVSDIADEVNFGEFTVQKRKLLDKKSMEQRKNLYSADYNKTSAKEDNILYRCYN